MFFVGKKIFVYLGISLPKVADLLVDLVELAVARTVSVAIDLGGCGW
jgi:hypothetical protein